MAKNYKTDMLQPHEKIELFEKLEKLSLKDIRLNLVLNIWSQKKINYINTYLEIRTKNENPISNDNCKFTDFVTKYQVAIVSSLLSSAIIILSLFQLLH
jgi:hypothetical protein